MLPLPGVLSTAVFTFLLAWNDYWIAVVFLKADTSFTIGLALASARGFPGLDVIALVPPMREGDLQPGGNAPFGFDTPNLEAAMAEFSSRGVKFEDVMGGEGPVPPMAYFRDPDDNRILLVEETTR